MDATKAELESTIRRKRARLDAKLARIGDRIEDAKQTTKDAGVMAGTVVLVAAFVGAAALLVRALVSRSRARHRGRDIVLFARRR
jgi:hypothetical protein